MFEAFQGNDRLKNERARWITVRQRGKGWFYLQYMAAFSPITIILLGKFGRYIFPNSNRSLIASGALAVTLLFTFAVTTLMWRRGVRLTKQSC